MTDKIKELIKKIDGLCEPMFKFGDDRLENMVKNLTKQPLVDPAFKLFPCLYDTKRQLEKQNRHLVKVTSDLRDEDRTIQELDTGIEGKEATADEHSLIAEALAEVKKNAERIAEMETKMKESQDEMENEMEKMSSYAEILKNLARGVGSESLQPKAVVNGVNTHVKTSNRKKNLVFFGMLGRVNRVGENVD